MIRMWCDHCEEAIPESTRGVVRVRAGDREMKFHACAAHQKKLFDLIAGFANGKEQETRPSLPAS